MRKSVLMFLCVAVLVLAGPALAQTLTTTLDPQLWMKTTNQVNCLPTTGRGLPVKAVDDPYWTWTSTVWNGPQQNGYYVPVENYVPNDSWAMWPLPAGSTCTQQWFKTTLTLKACAAMNLTKVLVLNKYNSPSYEWTSKTTNPVLGINDDLYVWVNGKASAAGGVALAASLDPMWNGKFSPASWTYAHVLESDGWAVTNGIGLPTTDFHVGPNQIDILTDDVKDWGGLPHPVFNVTHSGSCVDVDIDIKPGSYPNSFNLNGSGVIPVAILGSATFDVTNVAPASLSFNGLAVRVKGNGAPQCSVQNVNGDAHMDLVCQFIDDPATWTGGVAIAILTGTINGTPFAGYDEINIVKP